MDGFSIREIVKKERKIPFPFVAEEIDGKL